VKPGQDYLVYIRTGLGDWKKHPERKTRFGAHDLELKMTLPAGEFMAEWLDTKKGASTEKTTFSHPGGLKTLSNPEFEDDVALLVRKM